MTLQPHDFSRPPSLNPDTRVKLTQWISRSNSLLTESLATFSVKVEIQLEDCVPGWPLEALREWSERAFAYRVRLEGASCASAIVLPNPLAQVVIGSMMGDQLDEWPEERELTIAEQSVGETFVKRVIDCLMEGWTEERSIQLKLAEQEPNFRRTKIFRFKEPFVICRSTIGTPIGSGQFCWVLPHEFLTHFYGTVKANETSTDVPARFQLESLAREMSAHATVRLGTVQLSAIQLSDLQVGDLVVLNQKTTEPLRAYISGKPRFLGWAGRIGNRQAFEITAELARRDRPSPVKPPTSNASNGEAVANS